MIAYNTLVDKIASLHGKMPVAHPPHAVPSEWIPTVVDTTTSAIREKLPVIIAFGANYDKGPGALGYLSTSRPNGSGPSVEADLHEPWRRRAIRHIEACAGLNVKTHWNGMLPYDTDKPEVPRTALGAVDRGFHFVMTNACPWVTDADWSPLRKEAMENVFQLLAHGGLRPSYWKYFKGLKKIVGGDAIWFGHGNAEIYGLFRLLWPELKLHGMWFFDSNLGQPSCMIKKSGNHSPTTTSTTTGK